MTEQATEGTAKRSSPAKMAARIVIALVLIVLIFWYLLKDISLADVWAAITAMSWVELVGLAVVAGWNLVTYALVWMTVTPGLGFGRAMVMTQATTAITNTVPAGSAIGIGMTYAMLHSWGFSRSRTTIAVLVYRALTWGLPVLVGVVCLLWWRKQSLTAPAESASSTGAARP